MISSANLAYLIGNAAIDKKAMDVKILNVSDISPITDFFVICSANSSVQVKAIADEIEDKMEKKGTDLKHKEGYTSAKWVLLDYGNVIAHVFNTEDRDFYDLERLWADAQIISI